MNNLIFRPATLSELDILKDFEQGVISAERPFDSTLKPGSITYYDLRELIQSSESEIIVAICNDQVIASSYVKIFAAKPYLKHDFYAYLGFMYVKPEFRGKGVNKKIIAEIKNWCTKKKIYELRLDVYSNNAPAIKAYEKAGFKNNLVNMRMAIE
ncbi:GNAT family N-acetyltransferase [Maribacter sp.]|uniref:GNAT family N-acetyltransferase n=1 Tax=Maribacter sp. TaxID=1897614 RepID=UPI0025BC3805|nr:GNAT family N-acetyltransferase [Maribacter sp.]